MANRKRRAWTMTPRQAGIIKAILKLNAMGNFQPKYNDISQLCDFAASQLYRSCEPLIERGWLAVNLDEKNVKYLTVTKCPPEIDDIASGEKVAPAARNVKNYKKRPKGWLVSQDYIHRVYGGEKYKNMRGVEIDRSAPVPLNGGVHTSWDMAA